MPIYQYRCDRCGLPFERFYKTFGTAVLFESEAACDCGGTGKRQAETPFPALFFGTGWSKASALKRYNTKLSSKEGNN